MKVLLSRDLVYVFRLLGGASPACHAGQQGDFPDQMYSEDSRSGFERHPAPQIQSPLYFILGVLIKQGRYVRPIKLSPRVLRGHIARG